MTKDDSAVKAPKFTEEERKDLEEAFNAIDVDKNGTLDYSELQIFMTECGLDTEFGPLIMKLIDKDGNQTVDMNEFLIFIDLLRQVEKKPTLFFEMLFKIIDKDGNGRLDQNEIKEFVSYFSPAEGSVQDDEIADFINEFDEDHDGLITYDEFAKILS